MPCQYNSFIKYFSATDIYRLFGLFNNPEKLKIKI